MTPRWPVSAKEHCCASQILPWLRAHGLIAAGSRSLPAGFPGSAGSVKNGLDGHTDVTVSRVTDYDGASLMFGLTGVAEAPSQGLSYWRTSEVNAWMASQ